MIGLPDFSVFAVPSPVSKIRDGVAEALRADQEIAHFLDATLTGMTYGTDGRIYVSASPVTVPDRPLPFVSVYTVRWRYGKLLSHEMQVFATIGVSLFWDETREVLVSGDMSTSENFFNRAYCTLASDPGLELVPSGVAARLATGKGLADSMLEAEAQDMNVLAAKDPDHATVERALFIEWSTTASILTGTPQ